jgi:hypothetical protein
MQAALRIGFVIALALAFAPPAGAAEPTADEVLARLRDLDATTRKWSDRA